MVRICFAGMSKNKLNHVINQNISDLSAFDDFFEEEFSSPIEERLREASTATKRSPHQKTWSTPKTNHDADFTGFLTYYNEKLDPKSSEARSKTSMRRKSRSVYLPGNGLKENNVQNELRSNLHTLTQDEKLSPKEFTLPTIPKNEGSDYLLKVKEILIDDGIKINETYYSQMLKKIDKRSFARSN